MEKSSHQQAADILWAAWRAGEWLVSLPKEIQPSSRREGYAIQACLEARSAGPLYGWKIAATSLAGQKHIGVTGPLAGRILAQQVVPAGSVVSLGGNHMRLAECEFAFVMGESLPPQKKPWDQAEVMAAVASLHPAIELPDTRFEACEKIGEAMLIADNACAHQFMLGAPAPASWRALDLAKHSVEATVRNAPLALKGTAAVPSYVSAPHHKGVGLNVLGDPRIALTWLANELSALGLTLAAGAVVTTGTCVTPIAVLPGDEVFVDFGVLGSIKAKFSD